MKARLLLVLTAAAAVVASSVLVVHADDGDGGGHPGTATPIQHLVVIFQENVSFDHYFGAYPTAANPSGEPAFHAKSSTPTVNGLNPALLETNPNLSNPQRLDRSQALTCDQDHDYKAEQLAADHGAMDMFVQDTGPKTVAQCTGTATGTSPNYAVMDYYDGNTVTALWNYAQHFAMSDNSFGSSYGPSTPGVFSLAAGNTFGATCGPVSAVYWPGTATACGAAPGSAGPMVSQGPGTVYSDGDPFYDACSNKTAGSTIAMGGKNVGDLLNTAGVTWGWFQGGFSSPGYVPGNLSTFNPSTICTGTHKNIGGSTVSDYSAHHQPFEYWPQTSNPSHLPPTSIAMIGRQDQANHQYDLADFWAAANNGNLPAVSFLKAAKYQDGHAGYSDPLDEQQFLVDTLNRLQRLPEWSSTAVVIAYDDSDGWYDHVMAPILQQSQTSLDALTAAGQCGSQASKAPSGQQARCGYGPRLPLLVISPFARRDFVDHSLSSQTSILRFIETNWSTGTVGGGSVDTISGPLDSLFNFQSQDDQGTFVLDPATGEPSQN